MLKSLSLITALFLATGLLLPDIAQSHPRITFPQVIYTQPGRHRGEYGHRGRVYSNRHRRSIVVQEYPYGGVYRHRQRQILSPRISPGVVIIRPGRRVRSTVCTTAVLGSPIPSPVPLNQRTGTPCW